MTDDFVRFKDTVLPLLKEYDVQYKFFPDADFGDCIYVEFTKGQVGGEAWFWSSAWLRFAFMDFNVGDYSVNILARDDNPDRKALAFSELQRAIKES